MVTKTITAGVLKVAYDDYGPADGWSCIMCHGFPYDVHAYSETAPILARAGARVIVPYLRGYGPTQFISPQTPRSGEQASLGADLLALMDALEIERAVLGGYDWGGRATGPSATGLLSQPCKPRRHVRPESVSGIDCDVRGTAARKRTNRNI